MADTWTVLVPSVTSAKFSTNPITISSKTVLEVFVSEVSVVLEAEKIYSGEVYSGEV